MSLECALRPQWDNKLVNLEWFAQTLTFTNVVINF